MADIQKHIKCVYAGNPINGVFIWIHVGNKTVETENDDAGVRTNFALNGFRSVTLFVPNKPEYTWTAILNMICAYVNQQRESVRYMTSNICVGGAGMGGFYAYMAACKERVNRCALICPVLDPYAQYLYMTPELYRQEQQLLYFADTPILQEMSASAAGIEAPHTLCIITGNADIVAPSDVCFLGKQYTSLIGESHALCKNPTQHVYAILNEYAIPEDARPRTDNKKRKSCTI
jgi:hypothetical protein